MRPCLQKNAVEAVSQAMESEDVKSALATVDTELRYPSQAASEVPHASTATAEAAKLRNASAPTVPTGSAG